MGAFYTNALASGLVENGMCCVDSDEVLANVAKQKQDEDKERLNRSVAADGLLAMQTQASKGKCKSFRKIWTLCPVLRCVSRKQIQADSRPRVLSKNSGPFSQVCLLVCSLCITVCCSHEQQILRILTEQGRKSLPRSLPFSVCSVLVKCQAYFRFCIAIFFLLTLRVHHFRYSP